MHLEIRQNQANHSGYDLQIEVDPLLNMVN